MEDGVEPIYINLLHDRIMNRQNFDRTSVSNYPLTIDRMAELQDDLQVPLKIFADLQPFIGGANAASRTYYGCILSGCRRTGDPGYVMIQLSDGNGGYNMEVFEVKEGSSVSTYLVLTEGTTTVENSDGQNVDVRFERFLTWAVNTPASGVYVNFSTLPRMWVKVAENDDTVWTMCGGGGWWYSPANGFQARVMHEGGRVHLKAHVRFGLQIESVVVYNGDLTSLLETHGIERTTSTDTYKMPAGYKPASDVLVPILYNGTPGFAVINSDGELLLSQEPELGDTLVIDTYFEQ